MRIKTASEIMYIYILPMHELKGNLRGCILTLCPVKGKVRTCPVVQSVKDKIGTVKTKWTP